MKQQSGCKYTYQQDSNDTQYSQNDDENSD